MSSRAKLMASLAAATEKNISHIDNIKPLDDGFVCTFSHNLLPDLPHGFQIRFQHLADTFLAYTDDDVPSALARDLEDTVIKAAGLSVCSMLRGLSSRLQSSLGSAEMLSDKDEDEDDCSDWSADDTYGGDYDEDDEVELGSGMGLEEGKHDCIFGLDPKPPGAMTKAPEELATVDTVVQSRISRDIGRAQKSGFKATNICVSDRPTGDDMICLSARVDKLCLSDETRLAWNIDSADYVVLLIRYSDNAYINFDHLVNKNAGCPVEFRLRKCSKSKPTVRQSIAAFSQGKKRTWNSGDPDPSKEMGAPMFSMLHLGESIDRMMNEDFRAILKAKYQNAFSWDAAMAYTVEQKRSRMGASEPSSNRAKSLDDDCSSTCIDDDDFGKLPAFLMDDHALSDEERSLPLVAAQCAFRHFVRCVDYCMVCREKSSENLEALKPYVCDNPLCLFQYMNLGFGPSVEQEILSQPQVVDLLISFCCASLESGNDGKPRIRQFPTGLSLRIPDIQRRPPNSPWSAPNKEKWYPELDSSGCVHTSSAILTNPRPVTLYSTPDNTHAREDGLEWDGEAPKLGSWVTIATFHRGGKQNSLSAEVFHHGYVTETNSKDIHIHVVSRHKMPDGSPLNEVELEQFYSEQTRPAYLIPYNKNLDDLEEQHKPFSMGLLLATLPSMATMQKVISDSHNGYLSIFHHIVPSAWGLLRWIISSNRSSIVQLENPAQYGGSQQMTEAKRVGLESQRLHGVGGMVQFRFAQGSPDRERRFQDAIQDVQNSCRTIAAWHGSSFGNWHSIIREGLDYKKTESGRSYGDGVYFSPSFDTSKGYAHLNSGTGSVPMWMGSILRPRLCLALAELINKPGQFISRTPHLVVQHCHWIQCRYLVVKTSTTETWAPKAKSKGSRDKFESIQAPPRDSSEVFVQDKEYVATGTRFRQLSIPKIAMSFTKDTTILPISTQKDTAYGHAEDSDDESDNQDQDSRSEKEQSGSQTDALVTSKTAFTPGSLDLSRLRVLAAPPYATMSSQKALRKEIQKLEHTQSKTAPCELGWYMDFGRVENMFQWIVELHSFDLELPLGRDMQEAGIQSIVMEIRFGRDYPISPPFVRVVRPRFVPVFAGGGGFVTVGGAMCMELLTNSGWSPANNMESVLLQVRMAICHEDKPARLERQQGGRKGNYDISEAFEAYERAARTHGWEVPGDMREAIY